MCRAVSGRWARFAAAAIVAPSRVSRDRMKRLSVWACVAAARCAAAVAVVGPTTLLGVTLKCASKQWPPLSGPPPPKTLPEEAQFFPATVSGSGRLRYAGRDEEIVAVPP
jgi:hypothetical protein